MNIEVFAALKDYLPKRFTLDESFASVSELRVHLGKLYPGSTPLLQLSRFAKDDEFVDDDVPLAMGDNISIIPPSSGG